MVINAVITPAGNSGLAKGGILCFYESEVLYPSFVLPMKFSARKPAPQEEGFKPPELLVSEMRELLIVSLRY